VDDDADDTGRSPAQGLRVRIPNVAELADCVLDLRALHLGDRVAPIQHP
jgi:hypothetical protein